MRVLFYTAQHRGAVDAYDIHRLMSERPEHQYAAVAVRNPALSIGPWLRFKRAVVALRDGPDRWRKDQERFQVAVRRLVNGPFQFPADVSFVEKVNDAESERLIKDFQPDVIVQSGAGILKPSIFNLAKKATINVHHGVAPEVRGMHSAFWCLYYGLMDQLGVTCHVIDAQLDTGPVILQQKLEHRPGADLVAVQLALCVRGGELLVAAMDIYSLGKQPAITTTEVDSYYFSAVDKEKYKALVRNGFRTIGDRSELRTKKMPKKVFPPIEVDQRLQA